MELSLTEAIVLAAQEDRGHLKVIAPNSLLDAVRRYNKALDLTLPEDQREQYMQEALEKLVSGKNAGRMSQDPIKGLYLLAIGNCLLGETSTVKKYASEIIDRVESGNHLPKDSLEATAYIQAKYWHCQKVG